MQEQVQDEQYQWIQLNKSIQGIVNKVNKDNIQNIILELFGQNLIWGKGLFVNAVIRCQLANPKNTMVYACLINVMNSKFPEIGSLLINRLVLQFRQSYSVCDQLSCVGTLKFFAQLINQKVLDEVFGLQLLMLFLEDKTIDSIDMACLFLKECGNTLQLLSPDGLDEISNILRQILQEPGLPRVIQFLIEDIFYHKKSNFIEYPSIISELDLVDEDEIITHQLDLDDENISGEFQFDLYHPESNQEQWKEIKEEIVGEESEISEEEQQEEGYQNLREGVYMRIMNSVDYQEAAHKLISMNLNNQQKEEMCSMVVDCCLENKTYQQYYGLLGARLADVDGINRKSFFKIFIERYQTIHELEVLKIRKLANFYAFLLSQDAIDWYVFCCVVLTEEETTASSRIFLKLLFQKLAEFMTINKLMEKLQEPQLEEALEGIFYHQENEHLIFSINFFVQCGLNALTYDMRERVQSEPTMKKFKTNQQNKIYFC